jgi:hypothetical protein
MASGRFWEPPTTIHMVELKQETPERPPSSLGAYGGVGVNAHVDPFHTSAKESQFPVVSSRLEPTSRQAEGVHCATAHR